MKKALLTAVLTAGIVLSGAAAAFAADPYPAGDVPPTSGEPGSTIAFSVQTGLPNTPGTVMVEGDNLDGDAITSAVVTHSLTTTANGLAKFGVLLPADATPGSTYSINLAVGSFSKSFPITVADAQLATDPLATEPETPASPTSDNGVNPAVWWFGGGALALLAGGVGIFAARRNRAKSSSSAE